MTDSGYLLDRAGRRRSQASRFRPAALLLTPLLAILFQVYVPLFFAYLGYLELPLLVTVYFAMMRRRPVAGMLYGAAIGLTQDSLSSHPIGLFGIVKTLVGYLAATISLRFDLETPVARFVSASVFYVFHQALYWGLERTLLGSSLGFSVAETVLQGVLNGVVAIPLFHLLDKLRET